jgi:hypothetical protein
VDMDNQPTAARKLETRATRPVIEHRLWPLGFELQMFSSGRMLPIPRRLYKTQRIIDSPPRISYCLFFSQSTTVVPHYLRQVNLLVADSLRACEVNTFNQRFPP